jgi:hypothetical protein
LLTLAVGLAGGAKAEPDLDSANYQLPGCKAFANPSEAKSPLAQGFCAGTVSGIAFIIADSGHASACAHIPDGVTIGQEVQVVVRYADSG